MRSAYFGSNKLIKILKLWNLIQDEKRNCGWLGKANFKSIVLPMAGNQSFTFLHLAKTRIHLPSD